MYYEFLQEHKRKIVAIVLIFVALLLVWTGVVLVGRIGKVATTFAVVPSDATITIDGERIDSGVQWIAAKKYEVIIQKEGFKTHKKTVAITEVKKQNVVAASLAPESNEAKEWAEKHKDDYSENEKFGAIEASTEGKYFSDNNPITEKLPFVDPYYTISYTPNKDDSINLTIATPSPRYRFYAVEKIRELGYDPADFVIIFKDFKNPLETQ